MATTRLSPEEQLARSKLRALPQGVQVWVLETEPTPRYAVPSSSMDGTAYEVIVHNRDTQDVSCNCPGNTYRGTCKHVGAILVRLDIEAEMELASAAATEDRESQVTISQEDAERIDRELAELGL